MGIWSALAAAHAAMKATRKAATAIMRARPDIFGDDLRNLSDQPEKQPDDSDSVRDRVSALLYASDAIKAGIKTAKKTLDTAIVTATPYRRTQLEEAIDDLIYLCRYCTSIGVEPRRQRTYPSDLTPADLCTIREAMRQRKAAESAGDAEKVDSISASLNDLKARIWTAASKTGPVRLKDASAIAAAFKALESVLD